MVQKSLLVDNGFGSNSFEGVNSTGQVSRNSFPFPSRLGPLDLKPLYFQAIRDNTSLALMPIPTIERGGQHDLNEPLRGLFLGAQDLFRPGAIIPLHLTEPDFLDQLGTQGWDVAPLEPMLNVLRRHSEEIPQRKYPKELPPRADNAHFFPLGLMMSSWLSRHEQPFFTSGGRFMPKQDLLQVMLGHDLIEERIVTQENLLAEGINGQVVEAIGEMTRYYPPRKLTTAEKAPWQIHYAIKLGIHPLAEFFRQAKFLDNWLVQLQDLVIGAPSNPDLQQKVERTHLGIPLGMALTEAIGPTLARAYLDRIKPIE